MAPLIRKPEWESDYLLAQQAVRGDDGAWQALYEAALPAVTRHVRQCLIRELPAEETEDGIVNETFRRCYYRLKSFEGRSLFSTWVCAYARYVLLQSYQRAERNDKGLLLAQNAWQKSDGVASPEDIAIRHQRDQCLWGAFYSLPPAYQLLLQCHVLKEISIARTAAKTGIAFKNQQSELQRAKAMLKRRFLTLYYDNYFQ